VPVEITKKAADRFRSMSLGTGLMPRVEITAGGCNGFDKRFALDSRRDDDLMIDIGDGYCVLIDPITETMLSNSRIDLVNDISGSRFVIEIPEATSTCGCGTSFSI
jgi:iron-sulfur cluster insertion protein